MKWLLLTSLLFVNNALACGGDKGSPMIYAETWQESGESGVTVFTQKEYKSRSVQSLKLHIDFGKDSYVSVPVATSFEPYAKSLDIELSKFNASYIYLSRDLIKKAKLTVTYNFDYKKGEMMLGCGAIFNNYNLIDLTADA